MHTKAFHRILGMVFLFALVLLALPFWDGEDELSINEQVVHPPVFPKSTLNDSQEKTTSSFRIQPSVTESSVEMHSDLEKLFAEELQSSAVQPVRLSEVNEKKSLETGFLKHKKIEKKPKKIDQDIQSMTNASGQWLIQIEGFPSKLLAMNVVNQMRKNGYRAYLQSSFSSKTFQVWVDAIPDFKRAEQLSKQISFRMHLKTYVLRSAG